MAPALTKILKDGHGIHLSSTPASVRMDSDGRTMCSSGLESELIVSDDCELQKTWLNFSLFPSLDSSLPVGPLDVAANPVLTPCLQASAGQGEMVLFPSPASLFSLLSFNKGLKESQQVASVFPGVTDMFFVPATEYNCQKASMLHGCIAESDGGDVSLDSVPHSYPPGGINPQDCTPLFEPLPSVKQEKESRIVFPPPSSVQLCSLNMSSNQASPRALLEEAGKEQLCKQAWLCNRAQRLQKRLQALLGEHAVLHCSQQLEWMKRQYEQRGLSLDSVEAVDPHILSPQASCDSWLDSSFSELREFSSSSQALLRSLLDALDSEATASSSSDEDLEEVKTHGKTRVHHVSSSSCERRWLEERAELGSRWTWLQLRLAVLEGRIQKVAELHKHIRLNKGGVVLAHSQPLTDRQIQHTLLREMAGLSDADTEPCSPAHLLHNIERQSAQLSQMVNSLIPPLSFSPLSKQPHSWSDKGAFISGLKGDIVVPGSGKRQRLRRRRLFKTDKSCVCARTRPLVTYSKPRLFSVNTYSLSSSQVSATSMSTLSSSFSSFSCSCCSSCDPVTLCSDPDCNSSRVQPSRTPSSTPHPVLSSSFDTPLCNTLRRIQGREDWSLRPLVTSAHGSSPVHCSRRSSTPLHNRKCKQRGRHHKHRVKGLSLIRTADSAQSQHRSANQRKRKRRHIQRLIKEEEDVLYQLCDPEDSIGELIEESFTQVSHKQASEGCIRKRQGENVYNINNVVIPMSLAKVEKLQYKEVLTPSWRVVNTSPLVKTEEEKDEKNEVEELSDEVFIQRHLPLEQREKLHWSFWGKTRCCRRPNRSGSRLSGNGSGVCTSGEDSSVELSCAQLDTDEQQSPEEWLPQTPWETRMFPLDEDEEEALISDNSEMLPSGSNTFSSTSKNSTFQLSTAQSYSTTPPSSGQTRSHISDYKQEMTRPES